MPKISELPAETTPANDDPLAIVDNAGAITKKITREDLFKGTPLPADTVDEQAIEDESVPFPKLATGATTLGWVEDAGTGSLTTSFVTQVSVAGNSTGGTVRVTYSGFYINASSGANRTYDVRLQMDGNTVKTISGVNLAQVAGASNGHFFSYTFSHTPSSGAHTWAIQALASLGSAVQARHHSMEVREVI